MKFGNIVATMESLSEQGALGATEDALEAEQTATDVAEGNVEVTEGAKALEGMDTGIEDAFAAGDKIEDLLENAEETMKEGGMTEGQAKILEITHESIMSSIGMGHRHSGMSKNPLVTLESYASAGTRGSATAVTLEGLMDSAKSIANNIVKALKSLLNTVMNFLAGLVKNRWLMEKHLNNLAAQVEKIEAGAKPAKDKITGGAAALTVDGKAGVAEAKKILASAGKLCAASAAVAASIKTSKNGADAVSSARSAVKLLPKNGDGYGFLTGGRKVSIKEEGESLEVTVSESKGAKEIAAPSKAEMAGLLKDAKTVLQSLRDVEKAQTPLKDGVNAIIARLGEVANVVRSKVGSEESKKKQAEAAEVKKQARVARALLSKAGGTFPSAAFAAVKGVADYVTAGLKNLKAEEKKEEAKK